MDPYEETNRAVHAFNVRADRRVLRPVSKAYNFVTPTVGQHLIRNGVDFLKLPVYFFNYALQGEGQAAFRTLGRLTVNAVLGAGLLDPATEFGLPLEKTDFGITLGKWGVEQGPYIMLPFLGPMTRRGVIGIPGDIALNPMSYTGVFNSDFLNLFSIPLNLVDIVDNRNRNADVVDELLYNSEDSYITLRSVYLQRRQAMLAGDNEAEALPDIFE
jgi:phospholipid-binding lipoprotein MlaA